jgi:hypothetical protein
MAAVSWLAAAARQVQEEERYIYVSERFGNPRLTLSQFTKDESLRPVTVKQLNEAVEMGDEFKIDGTPFSQVLASFVMDWFRIVLTPCFVGHVHWSSS